MSDIDPPPGQTTRGEGSLPPDLRFLKWLVTALAGTMILGLLAIVGLLVTRLPGPPRPTLPDRIAMPGGRIAEAVTLGTGWIAVVTGGGTEVLIFDAASGRLRQMVPIAP